MRMFSKSSIVTLSDETEVSSQAPKYQVVVQLKDNEDRYPRTVFNLIDPRHRENEKGIGILIPSLLDNFRSTYLL
jgi:hypothetical protein